MISITRPLDEVNDGLDQTRRTRTRRQLARLLSLIDLMASFRRWHTAHEITYQLNERLDKRVSQRTVERDLDLLVSECLADSRMESPFVKFANSRTQVRTWRLLQEPTESLQEAAIQHEAAKDAESDSDALYALLIHTDEQGWFESANPPKPLERWSEIVSAFRGTSALVPVEDVARYASSGEWLEDEEEPTEAELLTWDVKLIDCETGIFIDAWSGLSYEEFVMRFQQWDAEIINCVLLPIPQGVDVDLTNLVNGPVETPAEVA